MPSICKPPGMTPRQSVRRGFPAAKTPSCLIIAREKTESSSPWIWILQTFRFTRRVRILALLSFARRTKTNGHYFLCCGGLSKFFLRDRQMANCGSSKLIEFATANNRLGECVVDVDLRGSGGACRVRWRRRSRLRVRGSRGVRGDRRGGGRRDRARRRALPCW
jgi:hypothetical protein